MDTNVALLSTGTGSTLLMVLVWFYKNAVGKKIRSRCCERDVEVGFSVEEMTPPTHHPPPHFVVNPLPRQLPPRPVSPDFV